MENNIKKIIVFLVLYVFLDKVYSQVNLQTGSATFSLPIFNWQDDKSRLNSVVALNYNSGNGLKVNDIAANVGQGWNLIKGGVINRMQVGEPDDQVAYFGTGDQTDQNIKRYPSGILYASVAAFKGCPNALTRYPIYKWKNQVYTQRMVIAEDKQLDYFSFQFNGKAGMFVLDPTNMGVANSLGDTKMKITFQQDAGLINQQIRTQITSFSIQDIDGIIYRFTKHGLTKVLQYNYCNKELMQELTQPKFKKDNVYYQKGFDNGQFVNPWVIDSWYLSEMEDPLTHRKVTFNYTAPRPVTNKAGEDITYNSDKDYSLISHKVSSTKSIDLDFIAYPDGHTVEFNYGNERLDLAEEFVVSSIDVKYQGRYISEYLLNTSYFLLNRYGTPVSDYEKRVARLCLLSVQKIGVDLKEDTPPYIFDYYRGSSVPGDFVPPPFFHAKDIWGFYNGDNSKGYSNEAIAFDISSSELNNKQTRGLCFLRNSGPGVLLNAKAGYAKNGLLRQIIYPTAGTLTYQYEQNTGSINGVDDAVGGVHVSSTITTDGNYSNGCSTPISTEYKYVMNGHGSASSLWGLEMPVNWMTAISHYQPEYKSYHWTFESAPFGQCYWNYTYPGIASQQQSMNLTRGQEVLTSIAPVLGIVSMVTTIMDVVTVATGGSPVALIIDIIGGLVNIALTCIGDQSRDSNVTLYYNSDMNGVAPLPTQFKKVEVMQNGGTNGKTVYEFTSSDDYAIWELTNPVFSAKQRFAPWAYGLPKLTTVYDADNKIVKEIKNIYDTTKAKRLIAPCSPHSGVTVECDPNNTTGLMSNLISCKCLVIKSSSQRNSDWSDPLQYNSAYLKSSSTDLQVDFYGMYTGRSELIQTIERTFKSSDATQKLETVSDFAYNNDKNYEINKISTVESNGLINIRDITYSSDFSNSQNSALTTLFQNNVLTLPVSTRTSVYNPATYLTQTLNEKVTEYTQLTNGDIKPLRILEQRFNQPATAIQYSPDNPNNASIYKTIQTFTYDVSGNLTGVKDEGNRSVSNIYDYQDKYVVASVVNADATLDKSAYSSFETAEYGGWALTGSGPIYSTPVTGARSFTLNGNTFTRSLLNTTKAYIVSFWASNSNVIVNGGATLTKSAPTINGFTYYEYDIALGTSSVSVTGNANIDELRLYPKLARMRTVTYDPLIGKTSECDENNRVTYYEYDNLGRLQFVKDDNKSIVKMYEYNNVSASKQNGCPGTYSNNLISEVFTKSCGAGYIGNRVPYTINYGAYSSSISQADADAKAENDILTNGQAYANTNGGSCKLLYYNTLRTQNFITANCPLGKVGGSVTYTVPANRYSSINIGEADQMAIDEIEANGEAYANSHPVCTISNDTSWSWLEGGASYCSVVSGSLHLFVQQTNINPNSQTFNQTRWYDMGVQDACSSQTCSFAAAPGFSIITSSISTSVTTGSFYIVFYSPSGTTNWSNTNQIASIVGGCKPSVNRTLSMTESGRTWEVIITNTGFVNVRLLSGTPPTGQNSIGLTGGSYNL